MVQDGVVVATDKLLDH